MSVRLHSQPLFYSLMVGNLIQETILLLFIHMYVFFVAFVSVASILSSSLCLYLSAFRGYRDALSHSHMSGHTSARHVQSILVIFFSTRGYDTGRNREEA